MILSDLEREMLGLATSASVLPAVQMLLAMGADRALVAGLAARGDLATAGVELSADGAVWSPGGPTRRLLIGVRDAEGRLIDIAAVSSTARDEWALRSGDGWALGLDALAACEDARDRALVLTEPGRAPRFVRLRMIGNPIDWLCAAGDGICVLDWGVMALTALRGLGERVTLEVDPQGKEWLRARLAHGGLPRIESARGGMGIAA